MFGMNRVTKTIQGKITDSQDEYRARSQILPITPFGQGVRWTATFWVYLEDLEYRRGKKKYVFKRKLPGSDHASIKMFIQQDNAGLVIDYWDSQGKKSANIGVLPLKKWQQITVIQDGNVLDVFLNDKVRFSSDPNTPVTSSSGEDIWLSPDGGWSGYRSFFSYSNYNWTMNEVKDSLSTGPLTMSWMNPLFYIYLAGDMVTSVNTSIISMFLPDPQAEAQKSLLARQSSN